MLSRLRVYNDVGFSKPTSVLFVRSKAKLSQTLPDGIGIRVVIPRQIWHSARGDQVVVMNRVKFAAFAPWWAIASGMLHSA